MTHGAEEIFEDVIATCEDVLAAIDGKIPPTAGAALLICLIVVAHDNNQDKHELMSYIGGRVRESWDQFSRERVEQAIRRMRIRKAH